MKMWMTKGAPVVLALALAAGGAVGLAGCDDSISATKSPSANLAPDRFTFSKVRFGTQDMRMVELENNGSGQLIIAKIDASRIGLPQEFRLRYGDSDDSAAFEQSIGYDFGAAADGFTYPIRLDPGQSIFFFLDYKPASDESPGGARGAIVLETNLAVNNGEIALPISVSQSGAEINVSPGSLNFDRVSAGRTEERTLTVTNIGQADLTITQMQLNGSQDFTPLINGRDPRRQPEILDDPDQDGAPGLSPDASFEILVRYAPQIEGPDQAELVIFSDSARSSELAVPLLANGQTPCLRTNPPSVEFPTSLVNRTDSRPLAIESCGGEPVEITNIYVSPDSDPAFELDT
ncbi:MAG: choice-of-anchor D domain-containing protein, partial [Myxococcales bacterium]|nr:choice-of-anchor D domain-containing protein [Myxococcales bacterium]